MPQGSVLWTLLFHLNTVTNEMKLIVFTSLLLVSSFSNGRPSRNYLNDDDDLEGNGKFVIFMFTVDVPAV